MRRLECIGVGLDARTNIANLVEGYSEATRRSPNFKNPASFVLASNGFDSTDERRGVLPDVWKPRDRFGQRLLLHCSHGNHEPAPGANRGDCNCSGGICRARCVIRMYALPISCTTAAARQAITAPLKPIRGTNAQQLNASKTPTNARRVVCGLKMRAAIRLTPSEALKKVT